MSSADKCPCIGCVPPKRTPTCHAKCTEYAKFYDKNEKKKQALKSDDEVAKYYFTKSKYIRKWKK